MCLKWKWSIFLYLFVANQCAVNAVIYHLNNSEYDRMPSLFGLDPYEPCLREPDGIYCMVELDLHGEPGNELMDLIKGYTEHTVKHYNHTYIQRGVCVQKTCQAFGNSSGADLNETLEECLNVSIWNEYGLEATLKQVYYCNKHGDVQQKDFYDWFVVGIFISILASNAIGSCYDVFSVRSRKGIKRKDGNQLILSFSLLRNWEWLTSSLPSDPRMERLTGLHSYRTITIILMAIAHVIWVNSMGFTQNPHDFEKAYETIHYQVIFNGMMIVQVFFVLSGFLMAYMILLRSEKQAITLRMFPKILFMRWWRLTPAYAVMIAFSTTWLRHAGSGPLWRLWVTDSVVANCRSYWWMHLLYIHNYFPDDRFCAIHTWHLSADMQAFVVSLLLFLSSAGTRSRVLVLTLLLVLGLMLPALHAWLQNLDGVMIMNPEFYRNKLGKAFEVHVLGHNYLASYAVGMGTAFLLYRLQKNGIDKKNNKVLQILSWCFFPVMVCLFLSGRGFYSDGARTVLALRVVWAAAHRLIMGGIVAFAILSLCMRFCESYCAVFEWPGWVVPGRLSYCFYLLHLNFIVYLIGNREYLAQVSFYNMVIVHLGVVTVSYIAAVPFYLMVEAPFTGLMKILTSQ